MSTRLQPLRWRDPVVTILDQRVLPERIAYIDCARMEEVREAIVTLAVRGAPLIGVAAAYAMVLAWREVSSQALSPDDLLAKYEVQARHLAAARPTAVNLSWAVEKMYRAATKTIMREGEANRVEAVLIATAGQIEAEDVTLNDRIGAAGAELFSEKVTILTHCNAGALATAGIGTALGVIRKLHDNGLLRHVFIDETRPLLQGARLTATELCAEHIPCTLICDNMAATVMESGQIDAVIVGADRICANGDTANKIGTYGLAILAAYHHVPFYIAAPFSTFDFSLAQGKDIVIEERDGDEVRYWQEYRTAPTDVNVYNPAFDVTPAALITGIITDRGVLTSPLAASIARFKEEVE